MRHSKAGKPALGLPSYFEYVSQLLKGTKPCHLDENEHTTYI